MTVKPAIYLLAFAMLLCQSVESLASDMVRSASRELERLSEELTALEKQEGKKAVVGELAVAKRWLNEGEVLLKEGRANKAAVLAERLQFQLQLIRVLIAAQQAWDKAELAGKRLDQALEKLALIKERHTRMLLRLHGAELTDAAPREEETP